MPPRGRPRKRVTRMHAAIDAVTPFGLDERFVRHHHVLKLLNDLGIWWSRGDDNWAFIEENGYTGLLDYLLGEANEEKEEDKYNEEREVGRHVQNSSSREQEALAAIVCSTSNTVADGEPISAGVQEEMENVALRASCSRPGRNMDCDPPAVENGYSNKDNRLYPSSSLAVNNSAGFARLSGQTSDVPSSSTANVTVQLTNCRAIRIPCYGWIDRDEGEDECLYSEPAAATHIPKPTVLSETNKKIRPN